MKLTLQQLEAYEREGVLLSPEFFSPSETEILNAEVSKLLTQDTPGRVFEEDGTTVRGLHGCHQTSELFARLVRHPRLLEPARQMLGGDVYVHQFKINVKAAFGGDSWAWHQDYIFWNKLDGIDSPQLVNLAIFVNEVHEFNGPLYVITGSHRHGMIDSTPAVKGGPDRPEWMSSFSTKLKYTLDRSEITHMLEDGELVAPKGPAGSVLFFHPNLAHGSVPNISPEDRTLIIITFNSVHNAPRPIANPRPEFLASRDVTPLELVSEEGLAAAPTGAADGMR